MPVNSNHDFEMQPHEYKTLRDQVHKISLQDNALGHVLSSIILHLGHLHGPDPVQEDNKAKDTEEARSKKEAEDAKSQDAAVSIDQQETRPMARKPVQGGDK